MCSPVVLFAALLAAPTSAAPADVPWYAPLGFSATLGTSLGIGTFVADAHADDPYYALDLELVPSWRFTEDLQLALRVAAYAEITNLLTPCRPASGPRPAGAPAEDCSDTSDPSGRRGDLDDLTLSLKHAKLYELEGVVLDGGTSIALPTSRASRIAKLLFSWSIDANVSRPFGLVTPSLGLSFTKVFALESAPTLEPSGDPLPLGHCPAGQPSHCLLLAGFVPTWQLGIELALGVEIPWVEGLGASASFGYRTVRKHGTGGDALSSRALDAAGDLVVDGTNSLDLTSGSVSLEYVPFEQWSFSFGVSSQQPALTADGKSVRFPFFDFVSPANNYTTWFLSVSFAH